jgi:penicillin-binding protein 2
MSKNITTYYYLLFGIISVFFYLIAGLVNLQILNRKKYKLISENNFVRIKKIKPPRGEILDVNYKPIVTNIPSYNLYFVGSKIKDKEKFIKFVAENTALTTKNIKSILHKNRYHKYTDILLVENIPYQKMLRISEKLSAYKSLFFRAESTRKYAYPNHFTGYTANITDDLYRKLKSKGYSLNDNIGRSGLEKYYENYLKGKNGYEIKQVDAQGKNLHLFKYHLEKKPVKGDNLILTIDNDVQNIIRKNFPKNMKGAVIIMNMETGGLLAYVSYPEIDPNIFMSPISNETWNSIVQNPQKPMFDRVLKGRFPPASTFKPVVGLFGLENNIIEKNTKLAECTGGLNVGNRYFKCWYSGGHGKLNIIDALSVSCDVYFYDLSLKIALDDISEFTKKCYLIDRTGIDLPKEVKGFIPDTKWYKKNYGKYVSILGQKVNLSIGQGEVLVTPLSLCAFYAAIGNNGVWKRPHLLKKIIGNDFEKDYTIETNRLPASQKNIKIIQEGLHKVVYGKYGTAKRIRLRGIDIYAKTGSAENHKKITHAWLGGYAKFKNGEKVAFTVFVENGGHGGSTCVPIARDVLEFYEKKIIAEKEKMEHSR